MPDQLQITDDLATDYGMRRRVRMPDGSEAMRQYLEPLFYRDPEVHDRLVEALRRASAWQHDSLSPLQWGEDEHGTWISRPDRGHRLSGLLPETQEATRYENFRGLFVKLAASLDALPPEAAAAVSMSLENVFIESARGLRADSPDRWPPDYRILWVPFCPEALLPETMSTARAERAAWLARPVPQRLAALFAAILEPARELWRPEGMPVNAARWTGGTRVDAGQQELLRELMAPNGVQRPLPNCAALVEALSEARHRAEITDTPAGPVRQGGPRVARIIREKRGWLIPAALVILCGAGFIAWERMRPSSVPQVSVVKRVRAVVTAADTPEKVLEKALRPEAAMNDFLDAADKLEDMQNPPPSAPGLPPSPRASPDQLLTVIGLIAGRSPLEAADRLTRLLEGVQKTDPANQELILKIITEFRGLRAAGLIPLETPGVLLAGSLVEKAAESLPDTEAVPLLMQGAALLTGDETIRSRLHDAAARRGCGEAMDISARRILSGSRVTVLEDARYLLATAAVFRTGNAVTPENPARAGEIVTRAAALTAWVPLETAAAAAAGGPEAAALLDGAVLFGSPTAPMKLAAVQPERKAELVKLAISRGDPGALFQTIAEAPAGERPALLKRTGALATPETIAIFGKEYVRDSCGAAFHQLAQADAAASSLDRQQAAVAAVQNDTAREELLQSRAASLQASAGNYWRQAARLEHLPSMISLANILLSELDEAVKNGEEPPPARREEVRRLVQRASALGHPAATSLLRRLPPS